MIDDTPRPPEQEYEGLPPPPRRRGLRTGFTTGATAAAAAKAATLALVRGERPTRIGLDLVEAGIRAEFRVVALEITGERAAATILKDGGDDPDATHGAEIRATVWRTAEVGIHLRGGVGVGTVTRPGLGLEVGGPAINPVPRVQIQRAVAEVAGGEFEPGGLVVEISVPRGEEIAKRTLNARLGILGGISILGTTGIVYPYSTAAYRASVIQGVDVAVANGCRIVVLSTGGKSEEFARGLHPELPEMAFVEMGEFTGVALDRCKETGVAVAVLSGMIGKFSKIAQGHFQTHVAGNRVDAGFLARLAAQAGADPGTVGEIAAANTARHVQEIALAHGLSALFPRICALVCARSRDRVRGALAVEALMFDFGGAVLARCRRG